MYQQSSSSDVVTRMYVEVNTGTETNQIIVYLCQQSECSLNILFDYFISQILVCFLKKILSCVLETILNSILDSYLCKQKTKTSW